MRNDAGVTATEQALARLGVTGAAGVPTPYVELDRGTWSRLREEHPMSLTQDDISRLRGLGDRLDLREVEDVYLPLSRLLHFYVEAVHGLRLATSEFLGERPSRVPFVVGVAGRWRSASRRRPASCAS